MNIPAFPRLARRAPRRPKYGNLLLREPLHKELSRLADAGLLLKDTVGNQVLYGANRDCPIFEELASIFRKTSGITDVLAGALASFSEKIVAAFVFGSMASGQEAAGSDVDLLVIGDVGFTEVVRAVYSAQEVLGREINPKVYSKEEWNQMLKNKDAFIKEVLKKPKLFITGSEDELG